MIARREFITLLGGAAVAWPLAARAQQGERMRRVGVLMAWLDTDQDIQARVAGFRQELGKLGWSEGVNVHIEERFGGDNMDHLRAQAAELIDLKVDAILVAGRRAVSVLRQQTQSVPIVLAGISDPAGQGLVATLARPGGNITGFSMFEFSVIGKMLEMLKQTAPGIARTAVIYNPDNPATDLFVLPAFERAAPALGVQPAGFAVHDAAEIERAIEAAARSPNGSLFFPPDVTVGIHRELIRAASTSGDLFRSGAGAERRPHVILAGPRRHLSPRGILRRSHSAWREARRFAGSAARQVRTGGEPECRQGARTHRAGQAPRRRRRGD